ncbi:hypothetical protein IHV09_21975 [Fictibacillus sp. 23RED33]|uniref:hypothetical protein n=1 Tax=Fictibacillus sp. 23RED33 TaxID=2745879 RepID=UPI0018CDDA63|nr:hypothetical protein [Fictibacillus sp. 23RED33]MBH0176228.1 hypothetical protein [Fictibacillus sp. 23RED33]
MEIVRKNFSDTELSPIMSVAVNVACPYCFKSRQVEAPAPGESNTVICKGFMCGKKFILEMEA